MALFGQKRRRPEPEEERPLPVLEEAPRPPRNVGALLREARRRQDGSVEDIAARLRIRASYLTAIEEGRYDELPGAAYALGFVRAYAEHLGLDPHEVARRFKSETAGLERRQDLSLPLPLPERSRPGGPLLLIALIVAACAYALWWYFDQGERTRPERVAEPPAEIAPRPVPPPVATIPVTPEPAPAETATAPAAEPAPPPVPVPATDTAQAPSAPAPGTTTPGTPALGAPSPGATAPGTTTLGTPGPGATVSGTAPTPAPGAAAPAPATPVPPAPSAPPVASALPPPPPPPPPDAAAAPEGPRVYGVTNGPARIIIRATADSWIQIRDRDGAQARILKPGEIYRVPDRPGQTLRTGNAGGIEVLVDGKTAPPLGPPGQARNVALDPERLLAGTAIERAEPRPAAPTAATQQ